MQRHGVTYLFIGKTGARHCQLVEGSALLPRELDAPDRF